MIRNVTPLWISSFAACGFATTFASAQFAADDPLPQLEGVEIVEHLDETVPLDLTFTNEDGKEIAIGDFFKSDRPVLFTPVYYKCPQLCTLILNGLVDSMRDIEWSVGEQFDIVTYTVAEEEGTDLAINKKKAYLSAYDRESASNGWHFLTGSKESIDTLSNAIGFKFKRQDDGLIAHSASVVFVTPDGRISRYMNDVLFQPRDLKYALIEASEGRIGTPMERFLLFNCFIYDPDANSYVASAMKIMRLGGLVTVIVMGIGLGYLWLRSTPAPSATAIEATA